jgi:hypothetical protein
MDIGFEIRGLLDLFLVVITFGTGLSVCMILLHITWLITNDLDGFFDKFLWVVKMKRTRCPFCHKEMEWKDSL